MSGLSIGVASPAEGLTCYVCDGMVVGRYYTLASCKTQVTKQRLVEKLGQLVGEQYMVVVNEDDVICRSCSTMLNNLDRLEKEMSSVRSVILRFLEKKYDLEEGELANSSKVVLPPPPTPLETAAAYKKVEKPFQTFHERKRQSAKSQSEQEVMKSNVYMQCDRCQYTTPYSSFMINHIHKHSEPKHSEPLPTKESDLTEKVLNEKETAETPNTQKVEEIDVQPELVQPVESVVTEVDAIMDVPVNGNEGDDGGETTEIDNDSAIVEMDPGESLCMVDENGVVQQVQQTEDGQFYIVVDDNDGAKQMLSIGEDGTAQMVQVMWDDIGNENLNF